FEQASHVDATGAPTGRIRINNRPCGQQRVFEDVGRTDVGLRGPRAHEDANTDLRDDDTVASRDFALRSKLVHQWRGVYHKIGGLTLLKTVRDSARISVGDRYLVSR